MNTVMNTVTYEWDVELVNEETDDVEDHMFQDSYAGCVAAVALGVAPGRRAEIVLVRDSACGDRSWAYVVNGALPTHFRDSYDEKTARVPVRFHEEVTEVRRPGAKDVVGPGWRGIIIRGE